MLFGAPDEQPRARVAVPPSPTAVVAQCVLFVMSIAIRSHPLPAQAPGSPAVRVIHASASAAICGGTPCPPSNSV